MEEPSVLDYLKSKIYFWRKNDLEIPSNLPFDFSSQLDESTLSVENLQKIGAGQELGVKGLLAAFLSLVPLAVVLVAITAQRLLEPPDRSPVTAVILYGLAAAILIWNVLSGRWVLPAGKEEGSGLFSISYRRVPGIITIGLIPISFLLFYGNKFTELNVIFWLINILFFLTTFWENPQATWESITGKFLSWKKNPGWTIRITPWLVLLTICFALAIYFRFHALNAVPGEMFSDHAEKLLDVSDVMSGDTSIFFPRNTGREAVQMYLTAAAALLAGTGLSFISLKIGTVLAGLFTLPFLYLIGKQIGGKWVGLFALILSGIGYWPNLISRIGLRFPLYPLFVAPTLYFLIRGLKNKNRMDLLLSGLALGLGLHGYSPFRIVPFVVLIAFGLYFLHSQSLEKRKNLGIMLLLLALAAFIIFLPLLKYITEEPVMFGLRAFTRMGSTERPLPGPALGIFLTNTWNAITMFFWDNGSIWVHSVVGRPALDVITAAFLFLGIIALSIRYVRKRDWMDLFMILSIPLLMMPSILSLAFPDENPSLNRTAGAIIPVFIIAAYGMVSFLSSLIEKIRGIRGKVFAGIMVIFLLGLSINQNYDLVFNQFNRQFMSGALNTSEIGSVVKAFTSLSGTPDTAYVVPYPYWVDTRLVGINAGYPTKDFALFPEGFEKTTEDPRTKLFILNPQDQADLDKIKLIYPDGILSTYKAKIEGKDFLTYLVPEKK